MLEAIERERQRMLEALSRSKSSEDLQAAARMTFEQYAEMAAAIEKRLLRLQDRIAGIPGNDQEVDEPERTIDSRELIRETPELSLSKRGCAVCDHLSRVLFDFLAGWQHALATDDRTQALHAAEGGFCSVHTWQLAAISSPKGLSVGYPKLLERLAEQAAGSDDGRTCPGVATTRTCRICRLLRDAQDECIRRLATRLQTRDGRQAWEQSFGVCLRHLPALVAAMPTQEGRRFVISELARHCATLAEDMHSFAMKQDATRRYLQSSEEADAWVRALRLVAGHKSLCLPWEPEPEV
jgi:hypothetical protein